MPELTSKMRERNGIISIVALGIFALLMIFGIIVQLTTIDAFENVRNSNNYYTARDIADSTMEYLNVVLKDRDAGYNTGDVNCVIENGTATASGTTSSGSVSTAPNPLCTKLATTITGNHKVEIDFTLKGRPTDTEKLKSNGCYWGPSADLKTKCYTVPFPGTGSAGDRCNMYEPDFYAATGASSTVDEDITGVSGLDQVNYSCNWNKLAFGSSLTDRITIPLYYETEDVSGNKIIVNPFNGGGATKFILRFRTPCECGYFDSTGQLTPSTALNCSGGVDPTVCADDKRYDLDDSDNDIVVQWQLNGLCPDAAGTLVECGLVPLGGGDVNTENSIINESFVNGYVSAATSRNIYQTLKGVRTDVDSFDSNDFNNWEQLSSWLARAQKPTLTIFLNAALKSDADRNVPYLEYQLVTDKPIGNPRNKMSVSVTVDGNNFSKTIYSEERKGLVDFAIQN